MKKKVLGNEKAPMCYRKQKKYKPTGVAARGVPQGIGLIFVNRGDGVGSPTDGGDKKRPTQWGGVEGMAWLGEENDRPSKMAACAKRHNA